MKIFETENSVVSQEDLHDGTDFICEFSVKLQKYRNRLTGSANETACARAIRQTITDETGAQARLEAYRAYPLFGRGSLPFLGLWYLFCYVLYFVSFAGSKLVGILLSALALAVFAAGMATVLTAHFGKKRKMRAMLAPKVSYNVVSEFTKNTDPKRKERTVLIVDNHDAVVGNFFKEQRFSSKLAHIAIPLTAAVFVLFCILKIAIGTNTPSKITGLTVVPAILGVLGIVITMTRFSPFEKHAKQNNGVATSVAMATYAYFVEKSGVIDDDVRMVYVSLGGENSAHGGSEAFVKSHPEYASACVICIGDIESGDLKIVERNCMRNISYSTPMVSLIRSSAYEQKTDIPVQPHDTIVQKFASMHGNIADAFAINGNPTAAIVATENRSSERVLERNDIERLFSVTVGTVLKLLHDDISLPHDEQPIQTSSEIEIKTVFGK